MNDTASNLLKIPLPVHLILGWNQIHNHHMNSYMLKTPNPTHMTCNPQQDSGFPQENENKTLNYLLNKWSAISCLSCLLGSYDEGDNYDL